MLADANTDWPDSIVRRNIEWCSAIYYGAVRHAHWNHSKVSIFPSGKVSDENVRGWGKK